MATKTRKPLSRERVLAAAIRLADDGGIEALTMRKLARELGVEAMSLYNHVANKGDLVDAMVDVVVGEIELPAGGEWDAAIRACAVSAHDVLLRHPWACSLMMAPTSKPSLPEPRLRYMNWLLGRLREGGFSAGLTYHAYHTLDSHILGFTMWQLGHIAAAKVIGDDRDIRELVDAFLSTVPAGEYPYFLEHVHQHLDGTGGDGQQEFEFALDLILDGLRRARGPRGA